MKEALQKRAGTKEDPPIHIKERNQSSDEKVSDFASALKKLFKSAYPEETTTSAVLLQHFLAGLRPEISCQLLLKKKPSDFATALKDAVDIEYALEFNTSGDGVNTLTRGNRKKPETVDAVTLHQSLEALT